MDSKGKACDPLSLRYGDTALNSDFNTTDSYDFDSL